MSLVAVSLKKKAEVPIRDLSAPTSADLDQTWRILQGDRDGTLYVHCRAGRERTGTVLAAWMARRGGISYDDAMKRLRSLGDFRPLPGQEQAVRTWLASNVPS
ncbi:MAG: dual specificity protein phosphatase family protein [Planctomycetes bacterium]|nr:dual specificity protein phosphatase family protein [Planctomycetota bacterium]